MTTRVRLGLLASTAVVMLMVAPGAAWATTITVTPGLSDYDHVAADSACTLREAVTAANLNAGNTTDCANGGADVDTILLPAGTLTLDTDGLFEDANANGDLDIDLSAGPVTLDGADAAPGTTINTTVNSPSTQRILHSTATSTNTLTLRDLTITGGNSTAFGSGGGVFTSSQNGLVIDHCAITNNAARNTGGGVHASLGGAAELTVNNSVIRNNQVTGESFAQGGGIWATGQMTVTKSLIEDNTLTSTSTMAGDFAAGGGIHNNAATSAVELVIRDSSIVDNDVQGAQSLPGADAQGGGVSSSSPVEITNTTFSGNTATSADEARGAGLALNAPVGANAVFHSTFDLNDATGSPAIGEAVAAVGGTATTSAGGNVLAGPNALETCEQYSPNAVFSLTTDAGGNLDDGTSCDLDSAMDENQDANLDPLATAGALSPVDDTAGPPGAREQLPVHVPPLGSVAIDHATFPADCVDAEEVPSLLMADQRGFPRPVDGDSDSAADCDSGAVEFVPPPPPPPPPSGGTTSPPPAATQPTGLRTAALKRCAKIKNKRKKKRCKRRARLLPV